MPLPDSAPFPDAGSAPAPLLDDVALAPANGSLPKAVIAGCVAALIGGLVWGGISKATGYEIGWIAIGIGFLCGIAVRSIGKGEGPQFQITAAATALGGIAVGKIFAIMLYAQAENIDLSLSQAIQILPQFLSPIDALFVAIAVWQAWKVAVPAE